MINTDAHRVPQIDTHGTGEATLAPLIDKAEACALLAISEPTIWRLIRNGDLRSVKLGKRRMIVRESVYALIERRAS